MENKKLTENFYISEFTRSQTASRRGIDNSPNQEQKDNLKVLCENVLQPLRDHYGKSIRINSGFRCLALNTAIGGSGTSQHCEGEAADIDTLNDNSTLFFYIRRELDFDQLIWEYGNEDNPDWVHVSFNDGNNRKQVLRCEKVNGKTTYSIMA